MSSLAYIPNHAERAVGRLPIQYVGQPNLTALATISGEAVQPIEDSLFDMIENGSIALGHDSLLDQDGDLLVQPRFGLADPDYRVELYAKVFENESGGTPEELISIYKLLMQARMVYYQRLSAVGDARGMSFTAVGGTPIGSLDNIKAGMIRSLTAGTHISYFAEAEDVAFSFAGDPDPNGQGFGDYNDASVGGTLAWIF